MAVDYTQLQNVLNRTFREPLQEYVVRANPVLQALNKRAVASDKIYIKGVGDSSHSAGPVADGTSISASVSDQTTYLNPTLDWSTYVATFKVPKRLLEQLNGQPGMLGNVLQAEISNAAKDLADRIAQDIFAGDVANGIKGTISMIDDANTYAGVDRSVGANSNWRATVVDLEDGGSPSELSTGSLYQADEDFFANNGYGFTEQPGRFTAITDRKIMTKYKAMLESIDLSSLSSAHFVNRANSSGSLGYTNVGWMGIPMLRDRNVQSASGDLADSGRLYFLDMDSIELAVLNPDPNKSLIHQVQGYRSAERTNGMRTYIEILGNNGEFVEGYVKTYVQLVTNDAKAAGVVLKNIKNT
jgi:hypothetical protein